MRLLAILLFLLAGSANAAPVTWTIDSLLFDDGGSASGYFTYNVDTNTYSDINIVTTAGSALPGSTYNYLNPSPFGGSSDAALVVVDSFTPDLSGDMGMSILFASGLNNLGGTVAIAGYIEAMCSDAQCNAPTSPSREILSGSVSAVPVPAAVWLFGSALAGLGWLRRKPSV